MNALEVQRRLRNLADPRRAVNFTWFFKTGVGEYGEGDKFLGITVPVSRGVAREFRELPLPELAKLLASPMHECRFVALEILVMQYEATGKMIDKKKRAMEQKKVCDFYLANTAGVNNWDLVDTSAPYVLGGFLLTRPKERKVLYKLARSKNIWERRIAIVATQKLIAARQYEDTIKLSQLLLTDTHDLIHKAVGWMLREVGKKSLSTLKQFLAVHTPRMPRTALRYAIEKFPPSERQKYLAQKYSSTQ